MNSQKKFALPLLVAIYALTLSAAFGAEEQTSQQQASGNSSETTHLATPRKKGGLPPASHNAHGYRAAASGAVSASKGAVAKSVKAPATPPAGNFAQSALDSVDGMIHADEPRKAQPSTSSSDAVRASIVRDLAKAAPVKAGTIDEHVYDDGRREERVHSLGGDYCVTFQSPSNPTDGIDTMQYGLHPGGMSNGASIHSCGHRFD